MSSVSSSRHRLGLQLPMMLRIGEGPGNRNGTLYVSEYRLTVTLLTSSPYLILNLHSARTGEKYFGILNLPLSVTEVSSELHRMGSTITSNLREQAYFSNIVSTLCLQLIF